LTTLSPAGQSAVRGSQYPRLRAVPAYASTTGPEAIDLCVVAGLYLDPWQQYTLTDSLGERPDGNWAALQVGVEVSRQNGKGGLLEGRELTGLFLLGERLIIHSAHQFDTSLEAFGRLLALIEAHREFSRRIAKVTNSHGQEGITLKSGQRIRFRTRTKGGGRGFTGDCLILDEAMDIPESAHAALFPTLSARPNPQVWYTGSAVDQEVDDNGVVFARVRQAGLRGDPGVMWVEWSADLDINKLDPAKIADPTYWAQANPALGIRISADYISKELPALGYRKFAVERLGVGDWPRTDDVGLAIIDLGQWDALGDPGSEIAGSLCLAIDVAPGGSWSSICAAGLRPDGTPHVEITGREVLDHRRGTDWVAGRVAELDAAQNPVAIVADPRGPAGDVVVEIENVLGREITKASGADQAAAFAMFTNKVTQGALHHLGSPELRAAIDGAEKRPLGDEAYAWSRKNSTVDISPLVASTLALWGFATSEPVYATVIIIEPEPEGAPERGPKFPRTLSQADTTAKPLACGHRNIDGCNCPGRAA
jgi:hypothetical protein